MTQPVATVARTLWRIVYVNPNDATKIEEEYVVSTTQNDIWRPMNVIRAKHGYARKEIEIINLMKVSKDVYVEEEVL